MTKRGITGGRKGSMGRNRTLEIWVSSDEVARLEGISRVAVIWRCRHGLYRKVKKVKAHGGGGPGGQMWLIALSDPKISKMARHLFHLWRFIIPELRNILDQEINSRLSDLKNMIVALREDLR